MNPFDTLVLDEPPLTIGPDSLVAQGKSAVRRRCALTVAAGVSLAVGGTAVAVPLLPGDRPKVTVELGEPTPTAEPTSDVGVIASVVRVMSLDATQNGHAMLTMTPVPRFQDSRVTIDVVVDGSSASVGWGIPSEGPPAPAECGEHFLDCRRELLPDGSTLVEHRFVDQDAEANVARVFRPDGTEIQIDSLNVVQRLGESTPTSSGSGHPAYSLDQLRVLASEINDVLNRLG